MSYKYTDEEFEVVKKKMFDAFMTDRFIQSFNIEVLEFTQEHMRARFPMRSEYTNNFGSIHGGALYSVADMVSGILSCAQGFMSPTVSGNFNYLLPAKDTEYIYCDARIIRSGTTLVVVRIEMTDDNNALLDDGSFTFFKSDVAI